MKLIKGICAAAVILVAFGCTVYGAEGFSGINEEDDLGAADIQREIENAGEGQETETNSGDTGQQTGGGGQNILKLDDENFYSGMGDAYKNGYEPAVSNDTATIILPLYVDENIVLDSVKVTPELGAAENSPFIFKNYQKTFRVSTEKINGGDEVREVFLVRFDLALQSDRNNGVYPVTMNIEYTYNGMAMAKTYTSYVRITDGKSAEPQMEEGAAAVIPEEEKPTSEPKVIITKCLNVPEKIESGDAFSFKAVLKNTNKLKSIQNMTVTIGCETQGLSLKADSNVFYYDFLAAEGTLEIPLTFQCSEGISAGKYSITLNMSYDNPDAVALSSEGKIEINIAQKVDVDFEIGNMTDEMNAGDSIAIPVQALNLGRGKVYNVRCTVDAQGLTAATSLFLGDMEGGTALSGELKVFAGMVNPDGADDSERYGATSGKIVMSYEDENGNVQYIEKEICMKIMPLQMNTMDNMDKSDKEGEVSIGVQLAVGAGALAMLIAGGTGLGIVLKRRNLRRFRGDD